MNLRWNPSLLSGPLLIAATIACLFMVKHKVHGISKEINKLNASIMKTKEDIHILNTEWTFLTQPNKIAKLAEKHLDLQPMSSKDIKHLSIKNTPLNATLKATNEPTKSSEAKGGTE